VFKAPRPARPAAAAPSAPRRIAEPAASSVAAATAAPSSPARYIDEAPGSATVLTLGAHMCKWPIGDPATEGFTFCGRRSSDGPYCNEHASVAYQPAQAKKRSGGSELARSLRRYI
jgi:GcrA cell cycle regulator